MFSENRHMYSKIYKLHITVKSQDIAKQKYNLFHIWNWKKNTTTHQTNMSSEHISSPSHTHTYTQTSLDKHHIWMVYKLSFFCHSHGTQTNVDQECNDNNVNETGAKIPYLKLKDLNGEWSAWLLHRILAAIVMTAVRLYLFFSLSIYLFHFKNGQYRALTLSNYHSECTESTAISFLFEHWIDASVRN